MIEKIKGFSKDVQLEIKKVNYPSKDELIGSTWVVIIAVIISSLFLFIVDVSVAQIVKTIVR